MCSSIVAKGCVIAAVFLVVTVRASTDFLATNLLPDGEVEVRIRYHGISAKETTVSSRSQNSITLRQLTDGKHFIQLIYESDNIRDCEYLHQRGQVETFLAKFENDLNNLLPTSNVTIESLDNRELPEDISSWFSYAKLRVLCKKNHRAIKKALKLSRRKRGSGSARHERRKRDITEILQIPGTKWCGKGYSAQKYTHLGGFSKTDKCCRIHDTACPFWIGGFETKYGLFNWRVNTIMHCSCDDRFRACLKMAETSDANLVGKLFFNVVQTKCFVLKPKKLCARRSWWGKCTKKKYIKQAMLRDNLAY